MSVWQTCIVERGAMNEVLSPVPTVKPKDFTHLFVINFNKVQERKKETLRLK